MRTRAEGSRPQIALPPGEGGARAYVPSGLNRPYPEGVVYRVLGRDCTVSCSRTANLCARKWGGVSNSGATVLHLALELSDGGTLEMVAKILSPDAVNLKPDCHFDARLAEIAWARWWGEQGVPFVAQVYLRWVSHQTVSRERIHLFIAHCARLLEDCQRA